MPWIKKRLSNYTPYLDKGLFAFGQALVIFGRNLIQKESWLLCVMQYPVQVSQKYIFNLFSWLKGKWYGDCVCTRQNQIVRKKYHHKDFLDSMLVKPFNINTWMERSKPDLPKDIVHFLVNQPTHWCCIVSILSEKMLLVISERNFKSCSYTLRYLYTHYKKMYILWIWVNVLKADIL